jgi:hypothetical protein
VRGLALAALAGAASLGVSAGAHAAPVAIPSDSVVLSNEQTITRWAGAVEKAPVRQAPDPAARRVGQLHLWTEDGFSEVYLVLRRYRDAGGRDWLLIRLPMRPNGRRGWVREESLSQLGFTRLRLVVDRHRLVATLYRSGRAIWRSRIGVGKASTPTPGGRFWIREKFATRDPGGFYGPWAMGTSAYSNLSDWPGGGVVGIHGTSQPGLIPGRPSHGCIRMANGAITRLVRLVGVGTPVWVL